MFSLYFLIKHETLSEAKLMKLNNLFLTRSALIFYSFSQIIFARISISVFSLI